MLALLSFLLCLLGMSGAARYKTRLVLGTIPGSKLHLPYSFLENPRLCACRIVRDSHLEYREYSFLENPCLCACRIVKDKHLEYREYSFLENPCLCACRIVRDRHLE